MCLSTYWVKKRCKIHKLLLKDLSYSSLISVFTAFPYFGALNE